MKKIFLILACAFALSACSTTGGGNTSFSVKQPASKAVVFKPSKTVVLNSKNDIPKLGSVSGNTWDLKGGVLDGQKLKGKWRSQNENQEEVLRIKMNNLTIKNGFIYSFEGVVVQGENITFDNVVWPKVGEEALSAYEGNKNLTVKNCQFGNGVDKILQLNDPRGNTTITNNDFDHGICAVRFGLSEYKDKGGDGKASKNSFYGSETAYQVVGNRTLDIDEVSDKYDGVKIKYKTELGGKIK